MREYRERKKLSIMATTEAVGYSGTGGSRNRRGIELEKYKRRLIRSVARKLKEKTPDMWEEMKKEIGSNCKKLWERMRMLTLKKLQRLLQADDRVDLIGPVARMTITDWLLFDLVIVHEKIDVIERGKLNGEYNSKVLSNLFALVQRFEIEGKSGDELAEAWTSATVYYNSKGHQCSPMMLQRRWFQIKELTRHKFYKFWFNYRGNQRQLISAMADPPDKLQKAIALRYPTVITHKFLTWEEGIQNRTVILTEELGIKMRKVVSVNSTDTTAPDVVLIEPQIEVIDLGANSDSEDEELQLEGEIIQPPPLVNIKTEPVDAGEEFEEEHEVYYPPEKGIEFDEEIERLEKAEENLEHDIISQSTSLEKSKEVVIDPVPSFDDSEANSPSEVAKKTENSEKGLDDENNDDLNTVESNKEAVVIDDEDSEELCPTGDASTIHVEQVDSPVLSNDGEPLEKDCQFDVDVTNDSHMNETVHDSNGVIAEIASVTSEGIKVENIDDVVENVIMPSIDPMTNDVPDQLLPIISTISSAGVKVEKDVTILDVTVDSDTSTGHVGAAKDATENFEKSNEITIFDSDMSTDYVENARNIFENLDKTAALPVIATVSSKGVKIDIATAHIEDNLLTKFLTDKEHCSEVDDIVDVDIGNKPMYIPETKKDSKEDILDDFGDIRTDLHLADEGIDLADDGIAYVEDDEDDIITIQDPQSTEFKTDDKKFVKNGAKTGESEEEESVEEGTETTEYQKFDLKLLMHPVVYTVKLDDMSVLDDPSLYKQVHNKESIDKIYKLSKPVSKQSVVKSENEFKQELIEIAKDTEQLGNNNGENDDYLFRNESVEESNDSDSESKVIDDSSRVKLSSYMLQKPRYRSYNPVLLCKNPDFNTRLKKLSVGFFMSARNRTLLQSCIPMTIDMSKAFEDKLIDGTLYLKPTPIDSTVTIDLADDVELTSGALVKPSSVQQSLMSIDDTLENELKKCMAERVKRINLPDISQVRRLNQHLLTAEVTPLRLQNEISQDINKQCTQTSSTIELDPANYVQNIKNDINNLLSQQKAQSVLRTDANSNPVIPETHPIPSLPVEPNFVPIVQPTPPMVSINSPAPIVQPTHIPAQLVSSNNAPSNQQNTSKDPNAATNSSAPKVRKPIRKTVYPTLAWNKRPLYPNQLNQELHQSDALLTIDTLYKMLSAMDPCTKLNVVEPKKKPSKKKVERPKPVEVATTQVIDITADDEVPAKKARGRPKCKGIIRTKDADFCCWCSYRIDYVQRNKPDSAPRRHRCKPNQCVCCCKALYYDGDLATVAAAAQSIEIKQKEQHISQTIEHVVQLVNPMKMVKPMSDVSIQIDMTDDTQDESVSNTSPSKAVLLKTTDTTLDIEGTTLDTTKDRSAELTPLQPAQSKQPTPKIRVYSSSSSLPRSTTNTVPKVKTSNLFNQKHLNDRGNTYHNLSIRTYEEPKPNPYSIKMIPCSCTRPTISKVNQGKIEINGKTNCPMHKKRTKESKVFLSKKIITNENQPFFVGKDKILLTNIKMPSTKSEPIVVAPTVLPTTPNRLIGEPVVQTFSLPAGVQVVLLPDQTLTYIIQPNITLTPEENAILPQFLAALQQEINAVGITLPADRPLAKIDEMNYHEDNSSNKAENSDVSTPLKLNNGSSTEITRPNTQEDFQMEIDNLAAEKRTQENEDFEMRIDILSAQQKNVKPVSKSVESAISEIGTPKNPETETSNACGNIENDVPDKDDTLKTDNSKTSTAEEAISKKSVLSDLMEMSGIMEEDLAPSQVSTQQEPILLDTQNFVWHKEVPYDKIVTPIIEPNLPRIQYTATNKNGTFDLTAVTSFAELKYACDNKGIFFKLDLEDGQLTSINVCIQKYVNKSIPPLQYNEKSVIDLTDEPDISITGSTDDGANLSIANKNLMITLNDMNEQTPTRKIKISTILQKKKRLMERLSNNLKPVNVLQSKKHVARILKRNKTLHRDPQFTFYSKRKLDKIEAKIDLVDSDAPMEEEYLLSDDSSDDEPLIKKVERKLLKDALGLSFDTELEKKDEPILNETLSEGEPQLNIQRDSSGQEQQRSNVKDHKNPEQLDFQTISNVQENTGEQQQGDVRLNIEEDSGDQNRYEQDDDYLDQEDEEMNDISQPIMGPVPTNLVLSGGALNAHNIPLYTNYSANGEESQGEDNDDCILGV